MSSTENSWKAKTKSLDNTICFENLTFYSGSVDIDQGQGEGSRKKAEERFGVYWNIRGDGGGHGCRVKNPLGLETQIPVCCLLKGFTLSARGKTWSEKESVQARFFPNSTALLVPWWFHKVLFALIFFDSFSDIR